MQRNTDNTVIFTHAEVKSLTKLIKACHNAISSLPSDGDFLGWDNYRALQMWEGKLLGEVGDLDDYVESKKYTTIDEWLDAYGKSRR